MCEATTQLLAPDPFSSPRSGSRISQGFDFGLWVEADCWPLLTVAYDLPRNGLLGVCSSDREADEKIRLNLYININIIFASSKASNVTLFILAQSLQNQLREAENLKV